MGRVREDGVTQLSRYLDTLGEAESWLIIFDQRPDQAWETGLWREERQIDGKTLRLVGA